MSDDEITPDQDEPLPRPRIITLYASPKIDDGAFDEMFYRVSAAAHALNEDVTCTTGFQPMTWVWTRHMWRRGRNRVQEVEWPWPLVSVAHHGSVDGNPPVALIILNHKWVHPKRRLTVSLMNYLSRRSKRRWNE